MSSMLSRGLRARIYLMLLESTSIPLFVGFYLIFLSGYGLLTRRAAYLTLGLFNRSISVIIHVSSPLPYLMGVLMAIHSFAGFGLMILRHVRNESLAKLLEAIDLAMITIFTLQLTILEFR